MPFDPTPTPARAGLAAPALVGLLLGTACQLQQAVLMDWQVYAVGLVLPVLVWVLVRNFGVPAWVRLSSAVALGAVLAFGATGLRAHLFLQGALNPALEGKDIQLTAVVAAMPQRNEAGLRFRLNIESAQLAGQTVRVPGSVYVGWYTGVLSGVGGLEDAVELQRQPMALQAGERWQMTVRLKAPHGNSNPHGFDYELWLWEQGLQATGYVRAGPRDPVPQRLSTTWRHPVEQARQAVRDQIDSRVSDRRYAGLIAALVVGDQSAIDRADWDVFRATGVAHLMSISGLHITMFAWLASLLVGWLWRRSPRLCLSVAAPQAALLGGVLLAGAYALFSGWGLPSQRTILMLTTVAALRWTGRQWPWPQVWLLACAGVVLADPWALLQPGFWLSFVAVGVLFASNAGAERIPPGEAAARAGSLARVVVAAWAMLREQWVITLALTPLTLLLFGQVSLVSLLANALAIPWVTLLVTPLAMFGVVLAPLWDLAALASQALSVYLQWLADWPLASVSIARAPVWAGLAGALGGLLLVMRLPWAWRLLGLPLLLPVLLWQAPRPAAGEFELLAADIGQGNAVLVRTAHHALLFDAGPRLGRDSDAGQRVLVPLLRALDTELDMLVLSHRDSDHAGGAAAVLAMQTKASLLSSIEDTHELQSIRPAKRCLAGQRWQWDGVDFEVLHPRASDFTPSTKSNALSCTLRISNRTQSALLAGDIEAAQEARLVAQGAPLASTVLLVPHHGSKTSSSGAFLDAVQPRIALVQAGYRNRFGHPAEPVLVRYAERHIRVVDSPHCGAATWQSAAPDRVACHRMTGLRYWHHALPLP
jgi:competence protein ComEC